MAAGSTENVDEIVRRVTAQVVKEMKVHEEQAFGVADLRAHVSELAGLGGDASAWKITYDTKRTASFEGIRELAGIGGDLSAWKITYDTKRTPDIIARVIESADEG
jgi:hypothetical protein